VPLAAGSRLGPYEIATLIGAGGMGEVYRAKDVRLNRQVAIKVLPAAVSSDSDRLARFEREAQVLAALNHPNIAGIYGVEDSGGTPALVMELVEGPTLADRIARARLPVDEALAITRQLAEAIDAAHEQGIVHRDLKPANIKLRPDGTVKVLDFGLAKALEPVTGAASATAFADSPTIMSPALVTGSGVLLGTAAYMAPEQARGKSVDKRADIWAFGCVVYEMVVGRRAFEGDDVAQVFAAIIGHEPDWSAVPSSLRRLLRACLEKEPHQRLHDVADAWRLVDDEPARGAVRAQWRWRSLAVVSTLLIGLIAMSWIHFTESPIERRPVGFQLEPPDGTVSRDPFSTSPDGRFIAFAAAGSGTDIRLWIRALDSLDLRPIGGSENLSPFGAFWSPDSRSIAFVAGNVLKRVDVASGAVLTICPVGPNALFRGGTWSPGVILFAISNVGLTRVSENGGTPSPVIRASHGSPSNPVFLPDGRHFLYIASVQGVDRSIRVGSLDAGTEQHETNPVLITRASGVAFVDGHSGSPAHIMFDRDGALFAQPFDVTQLKTAGEPMLVASGLTTTSITSRTFSASNRDVLVYRSGELVDWPTLTWFDASGKSLGHVGSPARYGNVMLSPDGKRLAVSRTDDSPGSIHSWVLELDRGVFSRLIPGDTADTPQAISADGRISFTSAPTGQPKDMYSKRIGSLDEPELLLESSTVKHGNSWSRDGRFILYDDHHPTQRQDLWVLPLEGNRKPIPFLVTRADETLGQFSPDSRWVAYSSDESGRREIYVRGFAPDRSPATAVGQWQISPAGGDKPRWSIDGTQLFYINLDGELMGVPVRSGTTFEPGVPKRLFKVRVAGYAPYDVAPDGRFLVNAMPDAPARSALVVMVDWQSRLRKGTSR